MRRCEKAETGMQLRGRCGPNEERAKASRSGVREREGGARRANEERTKATKKRECPEHSSDEEKKGGRKRNKRGTTRVE